MNQLRTLQLLQLDMLKEVDRICRKNNIKYMLFAGTALGAVRHKGFIPWDDDLDIIMMRSEYEKFIKCATDEIDSELYFLQQEFSDHWPCHFSKLRKNNTAFIEKTVPKDQKQHQGIYIDIFPCDNLSDNRLIAKSQFLFSKVVIAKGLDKRGYLTDSFLKKCFMLVSKILPKGLLYKLAKAEKKNNTELVHAFFAASSKYERSVFCREWMEETYLVNFEDGMFPISKHYDKLLTTLYGEYMKLPSEDERKCKEHSMLVDFGNSYEKYLAWQKEQKIDVYTRSIR